MKRIIIYVLIFTFIVFPYTYVQASQENNMCNVENSDCISCGSEKVPRNWASISSTLINLLQVITPIIIIVMGMIDLIKGVSAAKEDEIKKGQKSFFKRLLAGSMVFLVILIVKLVVEIAAPDNSENANMWNCVDCFIAGNCQGL